MHIGTTEDAVSGRVTPVRRYVRLSGQGPSPQGRRPGRSVPSLSDVLFPRLADPDGGEAVRFGGRTLTYRGLARAAAATVRRLAGASRVAVWAEPQAETCVAVVAGLAAGVPVVPLNPGAGPGELGHIVADSAPSLLLAARGSRLPPELRGLPRLEVDLAGTGGLPDELLPDGTALVLYTSGTTGPPKGVPITRRAIETNLDALAEVWAWTARDRLAHALPLFHVHGLVLGVLGPLRRGGSVEHVGRFSPRAIAAALNGGATMAFMVPTMVRRVGLAAELDAGLARAFARPRLLVSGSAALPVAEHRRIERLTGQRIVERYGMTETLMNASMRVDGERLAGYVGPPLPGVDIRLVDDEGTPIEIADDATIGELQVRGPNVFAGYLNRPEETREAFVEGWFRTGDLAVRADVGCLRIVGRRSTDLIKSGGWRIGAGEVEAALLEHPGVAEAAVSGRADEDLGEHVAAWVVRAPGATTSADELAAHVGRLLAAHKRPREVYFVDELPRNAMGKVVKSALAPPEVRSSE